LRLGVSPEWTGYNSLMAWIEALKLMRPRALARVSRTASEAAEQTKEIRATLKALSKDTSKAMDDVASQIREMQGSLENRLADLSRELQAARLKESQLRAVMQRDLELEGEDVELRRHMTDVDGIGHHVRQAFAAAEFLQEPFPYAIVDDVLPSWLYEALVTGLPPVELYADREVNRQQLTVPFTLAPRYGQLVWRFMTHTVLDRILRPVIMERFGPSLQAFVHETFPAVAPDTIAAIPTQCSDGRIIYRRRGYYIKPHRDPKWGMITGILYLAKAGDDPRWGTDIYTVDGDAKAASLAPHWIKEEQCHHVRLVENRPNRLLVFLNSKGAHGARIPEELADVEIERSIYQFRLTPRSTTMRAMIASLPESEQRSWQGKFSDY
jgi:hypothetical protein